MWLVKHLMSDTTIVVDQELEWKRFQNKNKNSSIWKNKK